MSTLPVAKRCEQTQKEGDTAEKEADPIFLSFCQSMSKWVIEASSVLTLFLTLAQWDSMARSALIDPLDFHNFETGQDNIACKCNG